MAAAKKPPSMMASVMGGGKDEDTSLADDMDTEAMQSFIDAVKSGDAKAALAAYRDLPAPGGEMPMMGPEA